MERGPMCRERPQAVPFRVERHHIAAQSGQRHRAGGRSEGEIAALRRSEFRHQPVMSAVRMRRDTRACNHECRKHDDRTTCIHRFSLPPFELPARRADQRTDSVTVANSLVQRDVEPSPVRCTANSRQRPGAPNTTRAAPSRAAAPSPADQVGEDLHDYRRLLDGGDGPELAPTLRAVFQVDVEDALEQCRWMFRLAAEPNR